MKELVGKTKGGIDVFFDSENSHAATHIADTPQLLNLVKEIISSLESKEDYARFETNLGRVIGTSDLVETQENDDIVYAKRPNRDTYSRFVKNRQPVPSSWVTVELRKQNDNTYELFTAYVGKLTPSFPGNQFEVPESRAFWANHALAWGTQDIVFGSETTECPW